MLDHQEHIIAQLAEGLAFCLSHGAHRTDISTSNEALVAFAGQNDAADSLLIHSLKSCLQVCQNFGIQGIQCLGAVDGNDLNCTLHLGFYKCHCENLLFKSYQLSQTAPGRRKGSPVPFPVRVCHSVRIPRGGT